MTFQLNVALIRKLGGPLKCLAIFFDTLSMGDCAIRHWQTSGRLMQELNACTVYYANVLVLILKQAYLHTYISIDVVILHKMTCNIYYILCHISIPSLHLCIVTCNTIIFNYVSWHILTCWKMNKKYFLKLFKNKRLI